MIAILGESPLPSAQAVYERVAQEFPARFGVRWLAPLGFENTYAIAIRRATADSLHLRTLSDLARVSDRLRAGLTPDFIGRRDGLPGLEKAYGLRFRDVRTLGPTVKYQALDAGRVDVIDGYSTDGLIARYQENFDRGMALAQQDFAAERIKKVLLKLADRIEADGAGVTHGGAGERAHLLAEALLGVLDDPGHRHDR